MSLLIALLFLTPPAAEAALKGVADRYLDQVLALSPISATRLGDHRFDAALDEVGTRGRERAARLLRELAETTRKIDPGGLSPASQVDRKMLLNDLERQLFELEVVREWAWNPLVYTNLAGSALYGLVARDYAPLERRLGAAAARMELLPAFLAEVRATLELARVPRPHAETAVQQNLGAKSIIEERLRPAWKNAPPALRDRLEKAAESAVMALVEHQRWLERTVLPAAKGNFRLGAQLFDQRLRYVLDSPLGRAEIRRRAEEEMSRTRREMYAVARTLWQKEHPWDRLPAEPGADLQQVVIRGGLEIAYRELPNPDRVVAIVQESLERTTAFVRAHKLLTLPPDPIDIIVMPEFERGVYVAYCDSPGPLEKGQKTFYAVAPLPASWTPAQVRSFLREYNLVSLDDLTVHEAMPGHFVQIAHSNRYPSALRSILASGTFVEGWAVYAERMMVEAGYRKDDPRMRLIQLKWYLRAITNALLDQRIHAEGLTEDQAMRLMIEGAFQEEREAAGKWRRAQVTATQLSTYFVGYQEHADLRAAAERRWGKKFSLGAYHDKVLSFGSPPVRYVRALLLGERID